MHPRRRWRIDRNELRYLSLMKKLIFVCALALLASCNNPGNKTTDQKQDTGKITPVMTAKLPEAATFGIYCGECSQHCATMFRFDQTGVQPKLYVDYTDSYFDNGGVHCDSLLSDPKKIQLAERVVKNIPDTLLQLNKATARFGCPDCTDACGIYLELKDGNNVRKFYIDRITNQLSGDVKKYAERIIPLIEELKK
jgi:hypothetical protein